MTIWFASSAHSLFPLPLANVQEGGGLRLFHVLSIPRACNGAWFTVGAQKLDIHDDRTTEHDPSVPGPVPRSADICP